MTLSLSSPQVAELYPLKRVMMLGQTTFVPAKIDKVREWPAAGERVSHILL